MKYVSCNLCGADDTRLLFTGPDREFREHTQVYAFHQCQRCGLMYLNPRPDTPEEMAAIYPSRYTSYMQPGQRLVRWLRRQAWRPELHEIMRLTRPESAILEIGCATGEFLDTVRAWGRPNVRGLEFSAEAAAMAQQRYGLDVQPGEFDAAQFDAETFDLVVLRHVLEHLPNPRGTLQAMQRVLKPGGFAIFTIPNVESDTARLFGAEWYGWAIPRHFYGFPHQALKLMIRLAGFDLVSIIYSAAPNFWIGSVRYSLIARGMPHVARFFRYENPAALLLFAPAGVASAICKSSGIIRVILQKPHRHV